MVFSQPGDWNIGVIIPAHEFSEKSMCSRIPRRLTNLKKIEAIKFAVDEINKRKDILPNTTLGFYILDDCSKDTTAMVRALQFTQSSKLNKEQPNELSSYDVIGVIGAESSRNTVQIADLLSLFKIPVISYVSTSPLLSDKDTYPFFSRIVPSDSLQVSVLMDIIIKFNWNYVSIVYEDGSYGNEIYQAFKKLMNQNKKCLAVSRVVRGELTPDKAERIVKDLKSADGARAVVLVLITSDAVKIFKTVKRLGCSNHFTWLGTDGWGSNINDYKDVEDVALGSLTIGFHGVFVERLDNHIKHLTPANATYNPWFDAFFERNFDCKFGPIGNETKCDRWKNLSEGYAPSFMPGFVMDAVYAFAYSLEKSLQNCKDADIKDCIKGRRFLNVIRNTSFEGDNGMVGFDEFGDGKSTYAIRTLRETNGGYQLAVIGVWDTGKRLFTYFNTKNITWKSGFSNGDNPPRSQCSKDCPPGFAAILTKPQCCWYCQRCRNNERSVMIDQKLVCEVCPVFSWPDNSKTRCAPIKISKISYNNAIGISIMIVVIIMITGTMTCIVLYSKTNNLKSRNRELVFLIASGILASNIVSATFLISPSESSCNFILFGFHLSFTLVYSPFLLKAYKIHHADKKVPVLGEETPPTPVRNVVYYCFVVCIEVSRFQNFSGFYGERRGCYIRMTRFYLVFFFINLKYHMIC
ncbi:hypothetical protein LOTGIDRAFT_107939 [Lottia gigantea]|uniref:G-protein coupled receptors family 3 profile domain-containing protein n=1 Tax=Lottia gigantea TaxID=225164 RepID=V3ZSR6_LOTGI|nr:hypothetical protein LOTGIDRAFT_107939 [Lottia gigantea]ESO83931.1 hypothetical protein LOTGIDRAFT_107939 [Lottia gigantea]